MDAQTRDILSAIARGELDRLTPDQIAHAETALASDPAAEAELAAMQPPKAEAALAAPEPTAEMWSAAWQQIENATTTRTMPTTRRTWRVINPFIAAAACVLMAVLWNPSERDQAQAAEWPVTWTSDVVVEELEVSGDATPIVMRAGTDESISMIWIVLEEN